MDTRDYFIAAVMQLSKEKGCTQADIAKHLDDSPGNFSGFMTKVRNYSEEKRTAIAEFFNTTYIDMLNLGRDLTDELQTSKAIIKINEESALSSTEKSLYERIIVLERENAYLKAKLESLEKEGRTGTTVADRYPVDQRAAKPLPPEIPLLHDRRQPNQMIIETDLDGRYLTIDGPAWYPDAIGKTGFDYGTPEANELLRAAMDQLKRGKHVVITGFHTVDGRTCKSIMRRVGDKILIRSTDTTPVEDAIGDE